MIVPGRELGPREDLEADAIVVGSGCAGAVLARELAEAGFRTIVFEEGGHYGPEDYGRMRPSETCRLLYRNYATIPTIPLGDTPPVYILAGRCVGGSSLVNGGVCFRTPPDVLEKWRTSCGLADLGPEEMDRAFERVERTLDVGRVPDEMHNEAVRRLAAAAARKGWHGGAIERNVVDCNGCCRCLFGCPHDAKRPVTLNYLRLAAAAGTRIYSDCRIDRVRVRRGRAEGVEGSVLERRTRRPVRRFRARAGLVVVAASALESPLLLARSGIGRGSGQVGRNLTIHPAARVYGLFDDRVEGWNGSFQSYAVDHFGKEGIKMINIYPPLGVIASTLPGFGAANREAMNEVGRLGAFGCMISDTSTGRVRRTPFGVPAITYGMNPADKAKLLRGLGLVAELFFEAGARRVYLPFHELPSLDSPDEIRRIDPAAIDGRRIESSAQHPLGTCRMGIDPRSSVVRSDGRAHDVEGVYVVDGSIVPTSVNVNPQITIMAMATRIAWRILERGRGSFPR